MRLAFVLLAGCYLATGFAGFAAEASVAPRIANYQIDAHLDADTRQVKGRAVLRWKNTTTRPAPDLCVHLYLNAFRNNRTTLMTEIPDRADDWAARFSDPWGGIDVTAIHIGDKDVTGRLEFIQPDDGNRYDRSLARLPLERPIRPADDIEVAFEFVAQLPRVFMRSGHAAPFFFVAQWFPKVGVFQNGSWNCHQYHSMAEFFADFGTYDVRLTVPDDFIVGHTGVAQAEQDNDDHTKTIEVHAEDVHDFAWTADPRFEVVEEQMGEVRVRLLLQPHHTGQRERYLSGLRAALARYARWFGPYPYELLTIVDPGPGGSRAAGMEYPMLITLGTTWWMPAGIRVPELLAVHEFGHQYWYGMIANDEVNDAWLDEGINTYVEGLIMDEVFGPAASYLDVLGLRLDATAQQRFLYLAAGRYDPISKSAHTMLDAASYRSTSYAQAALMLGTLERYLGGDRLRSALQAYFQKWRFRHPTEADWRAAIEASTGEDLGWFFAQVLDGTGVLDYAVARVDVREVAPLQGRDVVPTRESVESTEATRYRAEVIVERRGEVRMPVDIVVAFEDGSETRALWDGQERWHRLDITSTERAAYAVVDPDGKLALDVNRLNNSRMRSTGTRGIVRLAGRWGLWLQGVLHVVTGL